MNGQGFLVKTQGFTLIELMIAIALGAMLTLGVTRIMINNKSTYVTLTSSAQMHENGRFAQQFIGQGLRTSGHWSNVLIEPDFSSDIRDAIPGRFDQQNQIIYGGDNDALDANVVDGTDTLMVLFNGSNTVRLQNCLGMTIDENEFALDSYFVRPAQVGEAVSSLACTSRVTDENGVEVAAKSGTQPLIFGVEDLQLMYGIGDNDQIQRYVSAADITDWLQVISVRVGVLASSVDQGTVVNNQTYSVLGRDITAPGDGRARQVFAETFSLRNRT